MSNLSFNEVQELSNAKATSNGTSLVTLFIPANSAMSLVSKKLTEELSTASNIKSRQVRNDVIDALKSAMFLTKNADYDSGDNGLVLVSGVTQS